MRPLTPSEKAAKRYNDRAAEIRRTIPQGSREYVKAMEAACAEYEAAMKQDTRKA
jgi:hypothetical protein